jgi:hypothetical protein
MSRVVYCLLIVNAVVMFAVWWQLYGLRADIKTIVKSLDTTLNVLEGLRVSVAGSLVEKAKLLKTGYSNAADGIKSLFK